MLTLEAKNAFLFFLHISITLSFLRLLFADRANWPLPYYGAMVGITTYFAGATAHQLWYWIWRHFGGGQAIWLTSSSLALMLCTGMVMAIGGACIIRTFTVERFGHKVWVTILTASVVATAAITLLLPRA